MAGAFAALMFAFGGVVTADEASKETPRQLAVRKIAESLGEATVKGEYAKVIDLTWDGAVAKMGGREKAIKAAEAGMKKIAADGWKIKSYRVRSVGEFHKEGEHSFAVVPTTLEITTPGSRIVSKNYLLGISNDDGKTWKFVDSAGIQDEAVRKKTLPPLPAALELPKREKPEVFKDKQALN
jgi:hypothetical protein